MYPKYIWVSSADEESIVNTYMRMDGIEKKYNGGSNNNRHFNYQPVNGRVHNFFLYKTKVITAHVPSLYLHTYIVPQRPYFREQPFFSNKIKTPENDVSRSKEIKDT